MSKRAIKKTITTVVIIAGVLFLISWVLTSNKKKNEAKTAVVSQSDDAVSVRVSSVSKDVASIDYTTNGNFAPARQMNFSSENSGRVVSVLVDEGTYVRKGQTLAIIKTDQLSIDLETAQAALDNATKDKQRYETAFRTGGVTQQQLDQVTLALENAQARVAQAKIRVNDANIRSSMNGIVNKRFIEPGAVVSPGTQLFEQVDVSSLKLNITVDEAQVARLKVGDKVTVKASVYPDKEFTGVINFIAAKADNSLNFPVEINIPSNPDNMLKAGMYGTAYFKGNSQIQSLFIPRTAFVGSVASGQVFVVSDSSTAKLLSVTAGRVVGDKVEILDGLSEGDKVITSGQINLSDGSRVSEIK